MSIKYLKGDATCPQAKGVKVLIHIVNSHGRWGKGFVMAVSKRWPQCRKEYLKWYNDRQNNDFALGNVQFIQAEKYIYVANMIGQEGIRGGSKGPPIRYEAVEQCLKKVADKCKELGASVHMPRIGCGLSGSSWQKIEPIVQRTLGDLDVTVYDYE